MAFPLTKNQLKIVEHVDGALMVKAGPGSGKTRVLTERIINLLELNKKRILALTFSNKAAEEITERIEQQLPEDKYEDVYIGTIHSFCLDVVINRGNLIGLPSGLVLFESDTDKMEILKKVFSDMPDIKNLISETQDKGKVLKNCLSQISKYKRDFVTPEVLLNSNNESEVKLAKIYEAYNNMMLAQRVLDFDDILFFAYRIFTERPQIAKSYTRLYKYIFVDEAQDLNSAQYKVLKALCVGFSNIMMVGDPAQSIYGFNGSDSRYMTKYFLEDFNPIQYKLTENFRSTRKIINAAKKIQDIDSNAVYPLEGEIEVHCFKDEEQEADWVFEKITNLLISGSKWVEDIKYEKIAIIARNRYVMSKIHEKLDDENIPYNFGPSSRNIESESIAMKIFEAGIRIIINPFDNVNFSQILNLINYNVKPDADWEQINYLEKLSNLDDENIDEKFLKYLNPIQQAWENLIRDEESFSKALRLLSRNLVPVEMDDQDDATENEQYLIQKDIEMWQDHWTKYCSQTIAGQRSLSHFRNQISLGRTQTHDTSGVSLLTVHMSKGLEYEVVFLIGLNEGTFPDYRASNEKEFEEESNNMFVALTRAKRICYLSYPQYKLMPWGKMKYQYPSKFIGMLGLD